MSKKTPASLRNKLPSREEIFASRWVKPFEHRFNKDYFWSLNRKKAAQSVAVGMFCGLMPGPTQMLSALLVAYIWRTNLPLAILTTLYTNPLTYMPLYYLAYLIGGQILGERLSGQPEWPQWQPGFWGELGDWLLGAGKPLLVGVPVLGLLLAVLGYFAVWWGWKIYAGYRWRKRQERRNG